MTLKTIYYCDRCENDIEKGGNDLTLKIDSVDVRKLKNIMGRKVPGTWVFDLNYDLCEPCARDFISFMRSIKGATTGHGE